MFLTNKSLPNRIFIQQCKRNMTSIKKLIKICKHGGLHGINGKGLVIRSYGYEGYVSKKVVLWFSTALVCKKA